MASARSVFGKAELVDAPYLVCTHPLSSAQAAWKGHLCGQSRLLILSSDMRGEHPCLKWMDASLSPVGA